MAIQIVNFGALINKNGLFMKFFILNIIFMHIYLFAQSDIQKIKIEKNCIRKRLYK